MRVTSQFVPRVALAVLASAALTLTACVESGAPLISNAKPLLGQEFRVHLYDRRRNVTRQAVDAGADGVDRHRRLCCHHAGRFEHIVCHGLSLIW